MPDGNVTSRGGDRTPELDGYDLYTLSSDNRVRTYTYTYTDESGEEQTVVSEGDNGRPEGLTLYYRDTSYITQSKMDAMKEAVSAFLGQVQSSNGKHRVAVVKFADDSFATTGGWGGGDYLIGDNFNGSYNYTQVIIDFTSDLGAVGSAVDGLDWGGATSADYGLALASDVFAGNKGLSGARDNVQKAVVFFTDGDPNHSNGFSSSVASDAIDYAKSMKDSGVTIYTVGIFNGANPSDTSSNTNRYMNAVSSNYPYAESSYYGGFVDLGDRVQSGDYYFAADDAESLRDVFEEIGESISSSVQAGADTVLTDTLTNDFVFAGDLPEGSYSEVEVEVNDATGNGDSPDWVLDSSYDTSGIIVSVSNGTINVEGFDYSANSVAKGSEGWQGKKLVITFPIEVNPESGQIDAARVPTNETGADAAGLVVDGEYISGGKLEQSPQVDLPARDADGTPVTVQVFVDGKPVSNPYDYITLGRNVGPNDRFNEFNAENVGADGVITCTFNYNNDNGHDCVDLDVALADDVSGYVIQGIKSWQVEGSSGTSNVTDNGKGGWKVDNVSGAGNHEGTDVTIYIRTAYSVAYHDWDGDLTYAPYNDTNSYIAAEDVTSTTDKSAYPTDNENPVEMSWKNTGYLTAITLPELPDAEEGYTADGWFLNSNGTGDKYQNSVNVSSVYEKADEDHVIHFYATQKQNTFDVTYAWGDFNPNDYGFEATLPAGSEDVQVGAEVTVATGSYGPYTTREHKVYTFNGWADEDGNPVSITDGKFEMPARNVTLTAQWIESDETSYSASYEFVSGATGMSLPEGVTNQLGEATDEGPYYKGDTVTNRKYNEEYKDVPVYDGTNTYVVGTWSFDSWNEDSAVVENANVTFTGTWKFTEAGSIV